VVPVAEPALSARLTVGESAETPVGVPANGMAEAAASIGDTIDEDDSRLGVIGPEAPRSGWLSDSVEEKSTSVGPFGRSTLELAESADRNGSLVRAESLVR